MGLSGLLWKLLFVVGAFGFCGLLCFIFYFLRVLVGKRFFLGREKGSVYECGFEPMIPTRISFSLRFFLIAVIFLVFDVEVVFLFTYVFSVAGSVDWGVIVGYGVFLGVLRFGLFHE